MKKYFPHISALILIFVLAFSVSELMFPQMIYASHTTPAAAGATATAGGTSIISTVLGFAGNIFLKPFGWLALLILRLGSLLTGLAGLILNYLVWFTIVDMTNKLSEIGTIDIAWKTIRDVANMGFIFVLLYAAIQTILGIGSDVKKVIVNIIIVAILINFSLFFTKVVIDASNVMSIAFYDAIAPGALSATATTGLSDALIQPLKIESLWKNPEVAKLTGEKLIIIGVLGTIFVLIAAFVFFAISILLVIRFIVLIFVLILSPLAFLGFALPQFKTQKDQWLQALLGQAFFAPIYFMLTWIVIIISRGLLVGTGSTMAGGDMSTALLGGVASDGITVIRPPLTSVAIIVNFIIVIVMLIASLIIAKQWADKAGHGVPGLTKWATGFAGGATLGMAGRFGRGTIGRAGAAVGDSERLKERAAQGGVGGMAARLALATGRKTGGASFDVRGSAMGGTLDAGKAQKGGFMQWKKDKAEKEAKFAESLAPSAKAIAKDKTLLGDEAEVEKEVKKREKAKQTMIANARDKEELKSAELRERSAHDTISRLEAELVAAEDTTKQGKNVELESAKAALVGIKRDAGEARRKTREDVEKITTGQDTEIEAIKAAEVSAASVIRKENFARAVEQSFWAKLRGHNYDAAARIRKGNKSAKELVDELLTATGEKTATPTPAASVAPVVAPSTTQTQPKTP